MSKYNIFNIDNSISVVRFQPNFGFGGGQNPNQRFGGRPGFNPQQQQQFGGFQHRPQQGFQQRPQQGFQQRPQQGFQQRPQQGFQQERPSFGQQGPRFGQQGPGPNFSQQGSGPRGPGPNFGQQGFQQRPQFPQQHAQNNRHGNRIYFKLCQF